MHKHFVKTILSAISSMCFFLTTPAPFFSIGQSYYFLRDMLRKCRNGYLHISRFLWQSFFDMSRYMYTFLWLNENLNETQHDNALKAQKVHFKFLR